jgi:HIV-1 Vpr-binding protein
MYSGDVHFINLDTGATEATHACHNSMINSIKQSTDGTLLLTSSVLVRPLAGLWRVGESLEQIYSFQDDTEMDFGRSSKDRLISTQMHAACIYDTETGELIASLHDANFANEYEHNKASFNYTDTLVLNDGIVWDLRTNPTTEYVHKFDKLSNVYSGIFHPNDVSLRPYFLICVL